MNPKRLRLTGLCSDTPDRAFFIDCEIGPMVAFCERPEKYPPKYSIDMVSGLNDNEKIFWFSGVFKFKTEFLTGSSHENCVYCHNPWLFYCPQCRMFSCIGRLNGQHLCPGCNRLDGIGSAFGPFFWSLSYEDYIEMENGKRWGPSNEECLEYLKTNKDWSSEGNLKFSEEKIDDPAPLLSPPPPAFGDVSASKASGRAKVKKFLKDKKN